jgi:N-acetyl-gamma-glutamyl-phosphate reductase
VDPDSWIVDAKSGTTGAGIKVSKTTHFSNVSDNFKAYGLKRHRHTIEIEENLGQLLGEPVHVQFTPHLLPVDRGILATAYAKALRPFEEDELQEHYRSFFEGEPFIRIREEGPDLKQVRGTNYCDIYPTYDERTRRILVISVIDNLVKGAAGQAIHNMNLMFDLPETAGLLVSPLQP